MRHMAKEPTSRSAANALKNPKINVHRGRSIVNRNAKMDRRKPYE
jgi:hypothetical protein